MIAKTLKAGLAAAAMLAAASSAVMADTLADIISRGKMVVGSKADYAPWGMRDAQGNIVGMEVDMAMDLAKRIGEKAGKTIEVEVVPVVASNRMQFLEQGKIDVMIATMSDKLERREVVGIVQPNYYSSGVAVFAHKDSGIKDWPDIEGKNICGTQGAWYNKEWGEKNKANMIVFKGVPEIEAALLDGRQDRPAAGEEVIIGIVHHRQVEPRTEVLELLERITPAVHLHRSAVVVYRVIERL